jgi:hypothetical protein
MLTGITGILVHGFSDANLQVPAYALLFYFLCAVIESPSDETVRVIEGRERHRSSLSSEQPPPQTISAEGRPRNRSSSSGPRANCGKLPEVARHTPPSSMMIGAHVLRGRQRVPLEGRFDVFPQRTGS